MRTAYVYARKSPSDTDETAGVAAQVKLCVEEAARRGLAVAGIFRDVAQSAWQAKHRPGYQELLATIRTSTETCTLIIRHNDRLHRSAEEFLAFRRLVQKHRWEVIAVLGGDWETTTASGVLSGTMISAIAEYESSLRSERVRSALQQRAERGLPANTRFRSFGFLEDGLTHHPEEAPFLRRAAEEFLAGKSMAQIAKEAGKSLHGMRHIFQNPRLIGIREFQGQRYDSAWEPILDRETWEAIQVLLDARRVPGAPRKHLLTGAGVSLLRCGPCGRPLTAGKANGYPAYRCMQPGCRAVSRQMARVDAYVIALVLHECALTAKPPLQRTETKKGAGEIAALQSRLQEIDDLLATPDGPSAQALLVARQKLEDALQQARAALVQTVTVSGPEGAPWQKALGAWERWWEEATLADRWALLASMVETVTVWPTQKGRPKKMAAGEPVYADGVSVAFR